jgi:hypothetical protein
MSEKWWTKDDLRRARTMVAPALFEAHRHSNPILGAPLTMMMSGGLIKAKPQIGRDGKPISWMISLTEFGQAVREDMKASV